MAMRSSSSLLFLLVLQVLQGLETTHAHAPFSPSSSSTTISSRRWPLLLVSGGNQEEPPSTTTSSLARGGSTTMKPIVVTSTAAANDREEDETTTTTPANATPTVILSDPVTTTIPANDEEEEEVATSTASLSTSSSQRNTLRLPFFFRKNSDHKQIAKTLKNRNSVNIRRKVLHAAFGLTFSLLNHMVPRETFLPGMALLSGATLVMELLRYRKGFGWMNDVLHGILGSSLRKHEMDGKFTGSFYFFTGVTLTAYLYPGVPASLGIAQLALADPSASYFGRQTRHVYWSRIENGLGGIGRNKGWLGFLGGALFCFPFNYRVLMLAAKHSSMTAGNVLLTSRSVIVKVSLLLGLAGALADLAVPTPALVLPKKILGVRVPPFHVDDNMVVPIFSALACTKVFDYYGIADLALSKWMVL